MAERNLDFDTVTDRTGTSSLKFDFAARRGKPDDLLSMWVADMDFRTSSYIQDALISQAQHGIYGYTETKEEYFEILKGWMKRQYDWDVDIRWLVKTPGIVFALAMAVQAFTKEGDAVLIQQPVYYPFSEVIEDNHRRLVDNTLVLREDGSYGIDFEDFEKKIEEEQVKLFFLCNPHNPVGRAWTKEELCRIGDLCVKHNVLVVSDDIHADFTWNGQHLIYAKLKPEFAEHSIICTSPTKTFNIAGLQISNIFIPNSRLRHAFRRQVGAAGYSQCNGAGIRACEAAYTHGEEWMQAMKEYVKANIEYTYEFVKANLPELRMAKPEATYLVWLDCRGLGLDASQLEDLIIKKAKLWLDGGFIFGPAGEGFQRVNVACPRSVLEEALGRLERAVHG
ncbi:MAG: pyridoxal phosphate-dependent aminotransferase [Lachnospiraceae bacterium]|nr:pyridoxal phosphate-dependent aminotransferase [Lachnospiraceae bacterium]